MRSPHLAPRHTPRRTLRTALAGAAAVALTIGVTACSGGSSDADADNADVKIGDLGLAERVPEAQKQSQDRRSV